MPGRPRNLTESLVPLTSMNALIGHGIFRCPAQHQRPVISAIYAVIFSISYIVAMVFTLDFIFEQPWYGDDERIVFLIIYVYEGIAIFDVMLSWCNAKRFGRIIEDLTKMDDTLRELGATFDYARIRNEGYALTLAWVVLVAAFNWMDTLWFHSVPISVGQRYAIVSVLHHPVHINSIVASNFCFVLRLVGARYKKVNKILEDMGERSAGRTIKFNAWNHPRNKTTFQPTVTISSFRTRKIFISRTPQSRKYLIGIIKHVHLELTKVGKSFNEACGIQMALEIGALFVMFTGLLYELYILVFNPSIADRSLRIVVIGSWIFVYFGKLMLINEIGEQVCTEARRTAEIIHTLDDDNGDFETRNEINQFSLQLLHDTIALSPGGFICLGHRFVKNFLATVTTYLVILIQMTPGTSTK